MYRLSLLLVGSSPHVESSRLFAYIKSSRAFALSGEYFVFFFFLCITIHLSLWLGVCVSVIEIHNNNNKKKNKNKNKSNNPSPIGTPTHIFLLYRSSCTITALTCDGRLHFSMVNCVQHKIENSRSAMAHWWDSSLTAITRKVTRRTEATATKSTTGVCAPKWCESLQRVESLEVIS